MLQVLTWCLTEDENIIQVHKHKLAYEGCQDAIHQRLKCSRSVSESKRKYPVLILTTVSTKCCLGYILLLQSDLVICLL